MGKKRLIARVDCLRAAVVPAMLAAGLLASPYPAAYCNPGDGGAAAVELLSAGRPEAGEDGSPKGWNMQRTTGGKAAVIPGGPAGEPAFRVEIQENERGYNQLQVNTREWLEVLDGAVYRVSFKARGSVDIQFRGGLWTAGRGNLHRQETSDVIGLSEDWAEISFPVKINNPQARLMSFALRLFGGAGDWAEIGPVSFAFLPGENPGIEMDDPDPVKKMLVEVRAGDSAAVLSLGGREWPVSAGEKRSIEVELRQGVSILALRAEAAGGSPYVAVRFPGHPEAEGRWRAAAAAEPGWKDADFDDSAWPAASPGDGGRMWAGGPGSAGAYFRQALLWNANHRGPEKCIVPPVREWGFSRDSLEHFNIALYSPFPLELDEIEFVLEMPEAFRLLEVVDRITGRTDRGNLPPSRVVEESFREEGALFRRYRVFYDPSATRYERFTACTVMYSLLPVKLEAEPEADRPAIRYRRLARGNFTELTQSVPVRVLPPVDGRLLSSLMVNQYSVMKLSNPSEEHLREIVRFGADLGMNFTSLRWWPGTSPELSEFTRRYYDEARKSGIRIFGNPWRNVPYWATAFGQEAGESHLGRWVRDTPGARARYFNDSRAWRLEDANANMHCPTFCSGEGAAGFREALYRDFLRMKEVMPDMEGIWLNWELRAWESRDGTGSWCFCGLCKEAFREYAGLGEGPELADAEILRAHFDGWERFRQRQSGILQREIQAAFNRLGAVFMSYSWPHHRDFWAPAAGYLDMVFSGVPGTSEAAGYTQELMDSSARYFKEELGIPFMMGQRFSYLGVSPRYDRRNLDSFKALSRDGTVDAPSWKTQVVRMMASMDGVDLGSLTEIVAGMAYYIGEATRLVAAYEDFFLEGAREDGWAVSDDVSYPDLLVLARGRERLVLLFNEGPGPRKARVRFPNAGRGRAGAVFEGGVEFDASAGVELLLPARDVVAVHVR